MYVAKQLFQSYIPILKHNSTYQIRGTWRDSYQTATAFKVTVGWAVTDIYTEPVCVHGDAVWREQFAWQLLRLQSADL